MNFRMHFAWGALLGLLIFAAAAAAPAESARIQDLLQQGKLDEALAATDTELEKDSANVTYRFLKGSILTRLNRLDEAAAIFQKMTEDHPELPEPYNNLAVVYAAQGDFEKAREALQKAINTHPSYATAHENLGDIYAKMASQAYNHALQLDQDNSTAKAKLSLITNLFPAPQAAPAAATVAQAPVVQPRPPAARPDAAVREPKPEAPAPGKTDTEPPAPAEPPVASTPVAAVTTETAPAPAPAPADQSASLEAIRRAVDLWATAWSAKELTAYLDCYADDFSPADGQPRSRWAEGRKARLAAPRFIKVEVIDLDLSMLGEDHAQASFMQDYQSDSMSDRIRKTLLLKRAGDRWLITQETIH